MHTMGRAPYLQPPYDDGRFRSTAFFVAANDRASVNDGSATFVPMFLSEVTHAWKSGRLPLDVALLTVSPPDKHGWCSLGVSVDVSLSALKHSKRVIAVVNPQMPRTHGEGIVHMSRIDDAVFIDEALPEHLPERGDAVEEQGSA